MKNNVLYYLSWYQICPYFTWKEPHLEHTLGAQSMYTSHKYIWIYIGTMYQTWVCHECEYYWMKHSYKTTLYVFELISRLSDYMSKFEKGRKNWWMTF